MQATDTPSIIHRYFMIKNSSFQTCNTLNIKALELYYNIKKWNIELDTLVIKVLKNIPFPKVEVIGIEEFKYYLEKWI